MHRRPDYVGTVDYQAKVLATDSAGTAYLLLNEAPWLVKKTPDETPWRDIPVRGTFEWATKLLVAVDGTLYVGGSSKFTGTVPQVQVQHLSAEGELLGAAWLEPAQDLGGIAQGSDGVIRVVSHTAGGLTLGRIMGDEIVAEGDPVPFSSYYDASRSPAAALVAGSDAYWAAAGAGEEAWITFGGETATILEDFSTSSVGGLAFDGANGWYLAWAEGWTNRYSGLGQFHPRLTRYDELGAALWTQYLTSNPESRPYPDSFYRTTGLVSFTDSVLFTLAHLPTTDDAYATRYGRDGTKLETVVGIEPVLLAAPAGPRSAVLLSAEHIYWTSFPETSTTSRDDGDECTADEFCTSGRCCVDAETQKGRCSSDACPFGTKCTDAEDCAGSVCAKPENARAGFCTSNCDETSACPTQAFCVDSQCLKACSGTDCALPNTECSSKSNAEDVTVTVCSIPPPPPPPKKANGESCEANDECANPYCCAIDSTGDKQCVSLSSMCKAEIGAPCENRTDCVSDRCLLADSGGGWCTRTCEVDTDCGINPISGTHNACLENQLGDKICFPGCRPSDTTCEQYSSSSECVLVGATLYPHCEG